MLTDPVLLTRLPLAVLARLAQVSRSLYTAIEQNIDGALVEEFDSSILQSYNEYAYSCSKFKFLNSIQRAIAHPNSMAKSDDELVIVFPWDDFRSRLDPQHRWDPYPKFTWEKHYRTYKPQLVALNCVAAIRQLRWCTRGYERDEMSLNILTPFMQVQTLEYFVYNTHWGAIMRYNGHSLAESGRAPTGCEGCFEAMNLCLIYNRLDLVQWMDQQKFVPAGGDPDSRPFSWGDQFTEAMEWYIFDGTFRPDWVIEDLAIVAGRAGNYSAVLRIYETYGILNKYALTYCLTTQPLSATEWVLQEKLLGWRDIFWVWKCYQRPDILQLVYEHFQAEASDILKEDYMKNAAYYGTAESITWMRSIGFELNLYYMKILLCRADLSLLECLTDEDLRSYDKKLRRRGRGGVIYDFEHNFRDFPNYSSQYSSEHKIIYGQDSYFTIAKYLASRGYWLSRAYVSRPWQLEESERQWIDENYWFINFSLSAVRSRATKIVSSILSRTSKILSSVVSRTSKILSSVLSS